LFIVICTSVIASWLKQAAAPSAAIARIQSPRGRSSRQVIRTERNRGK
jgi:hypothetical protein